MSNIGFIISSAGLVMVVLFCGVVALVSDTEALFGIDWMDKELLDRAFKNKSVKKFFSAYLRISLLMMVFGIVLQVAMAILNLK